MKLSKKKSQNIIITVAVLLFVFVAYNFSKSLFTSVDDQTLYLSHTAIDMQPPLRPLQLNKDQLLMSNFTPAQIVQAEVEKKRIGNQPHALSKKVSFNTENILEKNYALREYLDQWFLLYPNMSFMSMRYFIAQEVSQKYKNNNDANQAYKQIDEVFIAYINLLREIETLSSEDQSETHLKAKFNKIKKCAGFIWVRKQQILFMRSKKK